jgi:hypothetical protein
VNIVFSPVVVWQKWYIYYFIGFFILKVTTLMSDITHITKTSYIREQKTGFLEDLGVRYYQYMAKKAGLDKIDNLAIDDLPPDDIVGALTGNITLFAAIIAFSIGALTTTVSLWFEWKYSGELSPALYYTGYVLIILAMLLVEMVVLFWLGLKTTHGLACLTGDHRSHQSPTLPEMDTVPNILARAALEVPDPVVQYLGIDPLKHVPKSKLICVSLLYKVKVVLSNSLVNFILMGIFGKGSSRLGFAWVAIPITGLWDAFVIYKVTREARLRLFGNRLAQYMANEIVQPEIMDNLSAKAKEGAIRAVATMTVLSQNYHPNMLVLLVKMCETFEIENNAQYDNWDDFLTLLQTVTEKERYFILDMLCVSAAFDGHLSRLERFHLPQAFAELTDIYMLRIEKLKKVLLTGQMHQAKELCKLDFEAG